MACAPPCASHACGFKLANDGHDTRALQHYLGHKNSPLHRAFARSVQGLLEGLTVANPVSATGAVGEPCTSLADVLGSANPLIVIAIVIWLGKR